MEKIYLKKEENLPSFSVKCRIDLTRGDAIVLFIRRYGEFFASTDATLIIAIRNSEELDEEEGEEINADSLRCSSITVSPSLLESDVKEALVGLRVFKNIQ